MLDESRSEYKIEATLLGILIPYKSSLCKLRKGSDILLTTSLQLCQHNPRQSGHHDMLCVSEAKRKLHLGSPFSFSFFSFRKALYLDYF